MTKRSYVAPVALNLSNSAVDGDVMEPMAGCFVWGGTATINCAVGGQAC
jgi:hypothetical protein